MKNFRTILAALALPLAVLAPSRAAGPGGAPVHGGAGTIDASQPAPAQVDLGQLSLQRLMDIDVTSVSKRSQRLQEVASSIYVITAEDIRRSGATRLQDVLKMAPGAWLSDDSYTISAPAVRESAHPFGQTLLWILDGVPITNPVTGGIVFDVLDLPLADIQRIEVIKGPGGTIYGANAASGIISIFTKDGEASEGFQAALEGGTQGYLSPYVRYGFEPAENHFLTAWAKHKLHDGYDRNPLFSGDSLFPPLKGGGTLPTKRENRFPAADDDNQNALSYGVKWDFQPMGRWRWTGRINRSHVRSGKYLIAHHPWPEEPPPDPLAYENPPASQLPREDRLDQTMVQARLDYSLREGHSLFVNAYHWRHAHRWMGGPGFNNDYDITDLEFQDNLEAFGSHRFSAGANVRLVRFGFTDLGGGRTTLFADPDRDAWLFGAFLQDEIALGSRWRLTLGAKAETWTLISMAPEISPSLRLAYRAGPDLTFWAAGSRSVTTPSLSQRDMEYRVQQIQPGWWFRAQGLPEAPPAAGKWVAIIPAGDVRPGEYYTVEAGNRGMLGARLQWDMSAFYSWVRDQVSITSVDQSLQTVAPSPAVPGDTVVPMYNANLLEYGSYGGEALLRLFPADFLRLELSYSLFIKHDVRGLAIPGDPAGRTHDVSGIKADGNQTPEHVGRVKAEAALPWETDFTAMGIVSSPFGRGAEFNYITQRPDPENGVEVGPRSVQFQLDLSLRKSFHRDRIMATIWGRNLLANPFTEYYNQYVWSSYPHHVHRTFGGGLEYRF